MIDRIAWIGLTLSVLFISVGVAPAIHRTRAAILARYGIPCVDYAVSWFDKQTHRRAVHSALGYCYPRTPSLVKLFVLIDGISYADFDYKKGEMTTGDAKMLLDINTPKT